ncbi:DNA polymerase/3'-5' exonuclease PolX [Singulisphaera acidiphila]|uniref:DNA polymerase beta n=1 Tax=Singulisphaera acidiphila (strain ATCC BAA-1392 / DSM 18658 / VKM B-2454 / MOB10) TaxID=886293 RepID=L0DBD1_SINAD|nr:DNA polymerase/3'-5' exonuclease PolX [Singulisphaera acidiphila]AGA26552.1 DNA polymerase IV (family X) [Singulisphaera acidiphila DSM 18658]
METARIAQILSEMGTLLEVRGENPFRCRAYHNAAQTLKGLPSDLSEMIADGRLAETPGIGTTMFSKIVQLATTGHLPAYDDLRRATPPGLVALLRVPGLGPKKIKVLHDELKIESLADLRVAGEAKMIAPLKGFGAKTEQKILDGISFVESVGDRILQSKARRLVAPILEAIRQHPLVLRAEVCGSLRRRAETIGDLDILFSAENPVPVLDHFVKLPEVATVLAHGPTKASVRIADGVQCDLRGVEDSQFPFALHYFTGSKAHNIAIRRRALAHGYSLNEYSLSGEKGSVACKTEADLFAALGLAYIPPELREDVGEIEAAEKGPLPPLVELSDLTGTFHCHTDWSDGQATLEEMAQAAQSLGLTYLGIADHSRSAGYAGGLSIERVRQQWAAIDALNETFGGKFRIFKGTECDILGDGSLDYPDEILDGFDYVVASVHSSFGMPRDEMTARIVRAAANPRVTMLGHPTGRLLLARDAYAVDVDAVIEAAAKAGTMIEINASPHRLDLDDIHCRRAKAQGVTIVVNPDAHSTGGLADLDYGVGVARRAGLGVADLFNSAPLAKVAEALERRRKARH